MHTPRYHSQKLFANLDPPQIDYEDELYQAGHKIATIHTEYNVERVSYDDALLLITLKKVWTDGQGQPLGGHITLRFENAEVVSSPVNEGHETLIAITELRDIRILAPTPEEMKQGRTKGVEFSTDQGLWDVSFKEAWAEFDPTI